MRIHGAVESVSGCSAIQRSSSARRRFAVPGSVLSRRGIRRVGFEAKSESLRLTFGSAIRTSFHSPLPMDICRSSVSFRLQATKGLQVSRRDAAAGGDGVHRLVFREASQDR